MLVFTIAVCAFLGFFLIKFIFWDVPKHSSRYWKSVGAAVIGVSALCGFGYLAQKDENAGFWIGLLIMLFVGFAMLLSARKS